MKSLFLTLVTNLFLLTLISCGSSTSAVAIGNQAQNFSLTSLNGQKINSRSYESDITILNFWATWCQNCKEEIPMLKELAKDSGVKVVGIALDDGGLDVVKPFVQKNEINYTILLGNEKVFTRFHGISIPYTLVLNRQQQVVRIYYGPVSRASIEETLKTLG
ncbi:hypothetical protein C2W62_07220 [Candidatus Entotheonella serta]|nr:hypothetical protein C2W62_07220 [Candidatus Entotheonella serta]